MVQTSTQELLEREKARRERRNERDRLARAFLRNNYYLKQDPTAEIISNIPEGTTEAAIRAIARFYNRKALIRKILRESNDLSATA